MTHLFFVTDLAELRQAASHFSSVLDRGMVVTGDLSVAAEAERLRLPFMDEWSFLHAEDIGSNWELAQELANHWWINERQTSECRSAALARVASIELILPFEMGLNACTAYRRLLASVAMPIVHFFTRFPVGVARYGPVPLHAASTSVAQAMLRWCADRNGIQVHGHPAPSTPTSQHRRWKFPPPPPAPPLRRRWHDSDHIALMVDDGLHPKEAHQLERAFSTTPGWQAVRVSEFNLEALSTWPWEDADEVEQLREFWQRFTATRDVYTGSYPEIFSNPYFTFQFERIFEEMAKAARLSLPFAALLRAICPAVLVLGHDAFTIERALVATARSQGIPSVALLHSGLGHMVGYSPLLGDANRILVWNAIDQQALVGYGTAPERLKVVGSLRYDSQRGGAASTGRNRSAARVELGVTSQPVLLFLTATVTAGFGAVVSNPTDHRQAWAELVESARRHPGWTFLIKPHPTYDYYSYYRYLCQSGPSNLRLLENCPLGQALTAADIAVLVNYCTTAGLEAMLAGVPVIFLDTVRVRNVSQRDNLGGRGMITARSISRFEDSVDQLLWDSPIRQQNLADTRNLLSEVLPCWGRSSLERIKEEIQATARDRVEQSSSVASQAWANLAAFTRLMFAGKFNRASLCLKEVLPQSALAAQQMVYAAAVVVGLAVRNLSELRHVIRRSVRPLIRRLGLPTKDANLACRTAYETALIRYRCSGDGPSPAGLLSWAIIDLPLPLASNRRFQRLLIRALYGSVARLGNLQR